jgi:PAS domain S-box-containing protein
MVNEANPSREQKVAEAEIDRFRRNLGPFAVAAETTRMAMVFTDAAPGNPVIFVNKSFLSLTGYMREEVLGNSFNSLMARGADPEVLALVEAALEDSSDRDLEICYRRKDGSLFLAALLTSPVRDGSGAVVQHFTSLVDLTRQRKEQDHCKMLIDELNHRVKNTLSTVQSVVGQVLRNTTDPELIRESIESRLFALSRSHDLLALESWQGAWLYDLTKAALEPFESGDSRGERFAITGENIRLCPKATLALGIAFHELATNAVRYGALSNQTGSISLMWKVELRPEADRLILHWQEKGGPPVTPPIRKGFGARVIERGLTHELEGAVHLEYPTEGVVCTISIPTSRVSQNG